MLDSNPLPTAAPGLSVPRQKATELRLNAPLTTCVHPIFPFPALLRPITCPFPTSSPPVPYALPTPAHVSLAAAVSPPRVPYQLAHDDGAQLHVVAHHGHLLSSHDQRQESLGLRGLRCFIQQNVWEGVVVQAWVASTHARAADHVRPAQHFALRLSGYTVQVTTEQKSNYGYGCDRHGIENREMS